MAQAAFLAYFYCEMGAEFTAVVARNQIDADKYDPVSDHLIVTLNTVSDIGNYKLICCVASARCGGLYSESELDFGHLLGNTGEFPELGRAVVDKVYWRLWATNLFWQGVTAYLAYFNAPSSR